MMCKGYYYPKYWHRYQKGWHESPRANYDFDEEKSVYKISVELPGVKKEDIKIRATDNFVKLKAERKEEDGEEKPYKKRFYFRRNIDPKSIAAKYENGQLNLEVPLAEKIDFHDVVVG
ncbi:MAG: Hsp20/alpha crystallin family protein [Candidatus Odinarchaeota archaeon]